MLVDSKQKKLSTEEIILQATREIKSEYKPDQVLASILVEVQEDDCIMMREGNTLFIVHKGKGRNAFFRALNADTANNYLKNSLVFAKAMYEAGFDMMVTEFKDPTLLSIFKYVEKNRNQINPKGMGFAVQRTKDDGYRVTTALGPKRQGAMKWVA